MLYALELCHRRTQRPDLEPLVGDEGKQYLASVEADRDRTAAEASRDVEQCLARTGIEPNQSRGNIRTQRMQFEPRVERRVTRQCDRGRFRFGHLHGRETGRRRHRATGGMGVCHDGNVAQHVSGRCLSRRHKSEAYTRRHRIAEPHQQSGKALDGPRLALTADARRGFIGEPDRHHVDTESARFTGEPVAAPDLVTAGKAEEREAFEIKSRGCRLVAQAQPGGDPAHQLMPHIVCQGSCRQPEEPDSTDRHGERDHRPDLVVGVSSQHPGQQAAGEREARDQHQPAVAPRGQHARILRRQVRPQCRIVQRPEAGRLAIGCQTGRGHQLSTAAGPLEERTDAPPSPGSWVFLAFSRPNGTNTMGYPVARRGRRAVGSSFPGRKRHGCLRGQQAEGKTLL